MSSVKHIGSYANLPADPVPADLVKRQVDLAQQAAQLPSGKVRDELMAALEEIKRRLASLGYLQLP